MLQSIAWYVSLIGAVLLALVFLYVVASTGHPREFATVAPRALRASRRSLIIAFIILTPLVVWTLTLLPYAPTHGEPTENARRIDVTGHQWYWLLSDHTATVGETVAFHIGTEDVNHAFALYDPDQRLIAQTQAMPDYTNILEVRFDRPGQYLVLCTEYCGLAHHQMLSAVTVSPASKAP